MKVILFFTLVISSTPVFSSIYMERLKHDIDVPTHCQTVHATQFKKAQIKYFTYGSRGATKMGFDYEVDIKRENARKIWYAFRNEGHDFDKYIDSLRSNQKVQDHLQVIEADKDRKDYHFKAEGEILELLALHDLHKYYSADQYFFTGGVTYSKRPHSTIIGELDLIVARISDCTVVAVGESKLGSALTKAKEQLKRFRLYLGR